ncbi:MAG: hypothetical protein WEC33_00310, partial [Dehalococcoidia bacterium]
TTTMATRPQEKTMIIERLTFRAKYGQGDTLVGLLKEQIARQGAPRGGGASRIYTDRTGGMFTVEFEVEYPDLAAYARADEESQSMYGTPEFQEWFGKMTACTERGSRRLYNAEKV